MHCQIFNRVGQFKSLEFGAARQLKDAQRFVSLPDDESTAIWKELLRPKRGITGRLRNLESNSAFIQVPNVKCLIVDMASHEKSAVGAKLQGGRGGCGA
jgi:hypothetical protein